MLKYHNSIESAIRYHVSGVYFPFVVAQELDPKTAPIFVDLDGVEHIQSRRFLTFKDIESYLENAASYPNLHELIIPHSRNNDFAKCIGRIVFDFDVPLEIRVPNDFHSSIESLIKKVFNELYKNVDTDKFVFVWLICDNSKKLSEHLIVKNAVFEDWVEQLQLLYLQLIKYMKQDSIFDWCFVEGQNMLIDTQLARNNASLRMPLNSKIGGNNLIFVDSRFAFHDGLVCLYKQQDKNEQKIYWEYSLETLSDYNRKRTPFKNENYSPIDDEINESLMEDAFTLFKIHNDPSHGFVKGEIVGRFIALIRIRPSKCMVSGKLHENENAFLFVAPTKQVYFYCRRKCSFNDSIHKLLNVKSTSTSKVIKFS